MKQIDISKKLHIPRSTVNYNLVCFERRGFRLDALGRKYERFAALPAGVKAALLAPHLLQAWAPFGLAERVILISRVWNIDIAPRTLRRFYMQNNVRYRSSKKVFEQARGFGPLKDDAREEFALLLSNAIIQRRHIVYCDETTFSRDTILKKSWSAKGVPNLH